MGDKIELGEPDVIRNEDNILWLRAEIERLRAALEVCEVPVKRQRKEIERLQAVVDAAARYVNSLENGKNAEAMNLRLQALAQALAALKGVDAYPNTLRDLEDDK